MMTSMFGSVCVSIYHNWSVRNLGKTMISHVKYFQFCDTAIGSSGDKIVWVKTKNCQCL